MSLRSTASLLLCLLLAFAVQIAWAHPKQQSPSFYYGHDLSSVKILEDGNVTWKDSTRHNQTRPVEDILSDGGMNAVRLRLWVNPTAGQYDLPYTLSLAKRFSAAGHAIYLDFHFSSTWADPAHQSIPTNWPTSLTPLQATLRSYVSSTILSFHNAGVDLALVSLGNEIRNGMLWPIGQVDPSLTGRQGVENFKPLAKLLRAARQGVSDAVRRGARCPEVLIHIDNGWDGALQQRWYAAVTGSKIFTREDWDVFGVSFYPFYGAGATFAALGDSLKGLVERYRKPVIVAETDFPQVCDSATELSEPISASFKGQIEWTQDVIDVVRKVPGGFGRGVFYWEPAWLNNTGLGSACESAILFTGDWSGYPDTIVGVSDSSVNLFKH